MAPRREPISLVAERAVRYLRDQARPVASVPMARELLATATADEGTARLLLETAFAGDARLVCTEEGWRLSASAPRPARPTVEPDRVLLVLEGERPPGRRQPFRLRGVSALRLRGDDVISACGGQLVGPAPTDSLRPALHEALLDAVPVVHDAPGALPAFEDWLGEPVERPLSLRRLGHERLGLPARHDMSALAARLGLSWREGEDPLEQAEVLDACLRGLRRADETLDELREATVAPELDWTRFEFSREFLRNIPALPGTYRFRDAQGGLLYVGKSSDLRRRIGSYFREGRPRSPREQALLDALVRIEYTPSGSELEAVLREAEQIRRRNPAANTQREVHAQSGRAARLRSILILEGAETPWVLRAFLIHDGRLLGRVRIGRRGGGLAQVQRLLDDYFFSAPGGPTATPGPDLEVELVARWLAAHRDRAVAFDPTDLQSSAEVIERLRWFLARGDAHEPDGTPILPR